MATQTATTKSDAVPVTLAGLGILAGLVLGALVMNVPNPLWIGAILLGAFGVVATVVRVEWGLLALVFMIWTNLSDVLVQNHNVPSIAQPFIGLLLLAIVARWALFSEKPSGALGSSLLIGAYGLVGLIGLFYASDTISTQAALVAYAKDAVIAIVVTMLLKRGTILRGVIWAMLAAGIFMGSLTTYQQLTHTFLSSYGGFALAPFLNIIGEAEGYRISGPIGDPNFYGQILVVLVPLALDRLWNERAFLLRVLAFWAVVVCTLSVVFTFSRGGFLALVLVAGVTFIRRPPRLATFVVLLTLGVALIQFLPSNYIDRLGTLTDAIPGLGDPLSEVSIRGRLSENTVAWMMFQDNIFFGVGWLNYPVHYQDYSRLVGIDSRLTEREPHSLYLEVAAESGLVGLTVFGLLLFFAFRSIRQAVSTFSAKGLDDFAHMAAAIGVGFAGYLIGGLFLQAAYPRFFYLLVGIALALPHVAAHEKERIKETTAKAPAVTAEPELRQA